LGRSGYTDVIGKPGEGPSLNNAAEVDVFFAGALPEYVLLVAGKSGGIAMNQQNPAELMIDNLLVECNVIHAAHRHGVKKLLYLASSCVYPRGCPQPITEESLLTGPLEPTNEAYALAKLAGIGLCRAYNQQYGANFITGIPANVFGPHDDFSLDNSHVIAALIRKTHESKVNGAGSVQVWGSGNPRREFIFVEDLADACLFLMDNYDSPAPINIAGGTVLSIRQLAELIKQVIGYTGQLEFDATMPDGMPMKGLDGSRLTALGWMPSTSLEPGLRATYEWFMKTQMTGTAIDGS